MSSVTCIDFVIPIVGKDGLPRVEKEEKKKRKGKEEREKRQRPESLHMKEICKEKRIYVVSQSQRRKKINLGKVR